MGQELPRDFKGIWIPKKIWVHKELSFFEKMLWAEIDSLDCSEKGCFASNQYFQKFFNVSERTLQTGLSKLKSLGFIKTESFDGRTRVLKSVKYFPETTHENFYTSEVKNSAPLGSRILHPYNKEESKDKNLPPLTPPREPKPSPNKDEWRRRISSEWTDEEFNYAWGKAQRSKNKIVRVKEFLETCMQNYRDSNSFSSMKNDTSSIHRSIAKKYDEQIINGDLVNAKTDCVEFSSGSFFRSVKYDVTQEEWEKNTNIWFKEKKC